MALSWHCRGTVVALSWHCRGTVVALSWHCRGTVVALSWQCRGTVVSCGTGLPEFAGRFDIWQPQIPLLITRSSEPGNKKRKFARFQNARFMNLLGFA